MNLAQPLTVSGSAATSWSGRRYHMAGNSTLSLNRTGGTVAVAPGSSFTVNQGTLAVGGSIDPVTDSSSHVHVALTNNASFNVSTVTTPASTGVDVASLTGSGSTSVATGATLYVGSSPEPSIKHPSPSAATSRPTETMDQSMAPSRSQPQTPTAALDPARRLGADWQSGLHLAGRPRSTNRRLPHRQFHQERLAHRNRLRHASPRGNHRQSQYLHRSESFWRGPGRSQQQRRDPRWRRIRRPDKSRRSAQIRLQRRQRLLERLNRHHLHFRRHRPPASHKPSASSSTAMAQPIPPPSSACSTARPPRPPTSSLNTPTTATPISTASSTAPTTLQIDGGFVAASAISGTRAHGDFNYDGRIDGADYALIDNTFNQQGPALITPQAADRKRRTTSDCRDLRPTATPAADIATPALDSIPAASVSVPEPTTIGMLLPRSGRGSPKAGGGGRRNDEFRNPNQIALPKSSIRALLLLPPLPSGEGWGEGRN